MTRNIILDNLRGIAFLLMIMHHIFYFHDINKSTHYSQCSVIQIVGYLSRYLFILIVGYTLVYSYENNKEKFFKNRIKKSLEILFHATIITLITYYMYPHFFIRFGILHFIGLITLIFAFIVPHKKLYYLLFLIFILLNYIKLPHINNFIDTIIGIPHYNMMDYFPIVEWTPVVLAGMILKDNNFELDSIFNCELFTNNSILTSIGQNSLNLYTLHIIVLVILYKYILI